MYRMKSNIIILVVATLVIAAWAFWYYSTRTGNEPSLSVSAEGNQAQTRFQTLVRELQAVSFDTSIFSDPRFMALIDLTTPIVSEVAGRVDPFAPVPGVSEK